MKSNWPENIRCYTKLNTSQDKWWKHLGVILLNNWKFNLYSNDPVISKKLCIWNYIDKLLCEINHVSKVNIVCLFKTLCIMDVTPNETSTLFMSYPPCTLTPSTLHSTWILEGLTDLYTCRYLTFWKASENNTATIDIQKWKLLIYLVYLPIYVSRYHIRGLKIEELKDTLWS